VRYSTQRGSRFFSASQPPVLQLADEQEGIFAVVVVAIDRRPVFELEGAIEIERRSVALPNFEFRHLDTVTAEEIDTASKQEFPDPLAAVGLVDSQILDVSDEGPSVPDTVGDDVAVDGVVSSDQKARLAEILLERPERPRLWEGVRFDPVDREEIGSLGWANRNGRAILRRCSRHVNRYAIATDMCTGQERTENSVGTRREVAGLPLGISRRSRINIGPYCDRLCMTAEDQKYVITSLETEGSETEILTVELPSREIIAQLEVPRHFVDRMADLGAEHDISLEQALGERLELNRARVSLQSARAVESIGQVKEHLSEAQMYLSGVDALDTEGLEAEIERIWKEELDSRA